MKKRTQAREYAVQMMYQAEMTLDTSAKVKENIWKSFNKPSDEVCEYAEKLFDDAYKNADSHEQVVKQFLTDRWPFERLGDMEKCVLKVALEELLNYDTPDYAVLDEYVTIAKRFTDEKTAAFVNGFLERVKTMFKEAK